MILRRFRVSGIIYIAVNATDHVIINVVQGNQYNVYDFIPENTTIINVVWGDQHNTYNTIARTIGIVNIVMGHQYNYYNAT